jgi:hypothetical protein
VALPAAIARLEQEVQSAQAQVRKLELDLGDAVFKATDQLRFGSLEHELFDAFLVEFGKRKAAKEARDAAIG